MEIFRSSNPQPQEENAYSKLYREAKRLCTLEVENARLILTEKLTLMLGRLALVAVVFVVLAAALIFLTIAVADFLLSGLEPSWTFLIIAGFYVLIAVLAMIFNRRLILDPIARYVSRIILDPPSRAEAQRQNPQTSNPEAPAK